MINVGNTSFSLIIQARLLRTGQYLGSNLATMVFIDRQTRRPKQLSDWFRERINSFLFQADPMSQNIQPNTYPTGAFAHNVRVAYSEIDRNQHTNQAQYVKFCLDGANTAVMNGHFPGFTKHLGYYTPRQMSCTFIGESNAMDELIIYIWQDEVLQHKLYCQVHNKGKIIFLLTVVFDVSKTSESKL